MSERVHPRASLVSALASGFVFGIGLILAGMVDPGKVLAFLDVTGAWDPSLAVVMGGAIGVGAIGFRIAQRRTTTLFGEPSGLPAARGVDARLLAGAAIFGVGWGLSGICPGPAVVAAAGGHASVLAFLVPMLVGLASVDVYDRSHATAHDGRSETDAERGDPQARAVRGAAGSDISE